MDAFIDSKSLKADKSISGVKGYKKAVRRAKRDKRIEKGEIFIGTLIAAFFALLFLTPIILTATNSFMSASEISANYGTVFQTTDTGGKVYISKTVNLKFIPDMVSFTQYYTVLFKSPEYLIKFWNSVFYAVPIVVFQLFIAMLASYGFARYHGKVKDVIFFLYIILMLMPYQVTLVPNYMVSSWLGILDTRWAIWLPGIFSPFAVYLLTKFIRRIPFEVMEAAEIDGAGEWQIFSQVCMPLCKGGIISISILVFIDFWNMVEQPLILLTDDQMYPLSVFLSKINSGEISLAFAVAVIYMVPPLLIFLYGEEYLVQGISYQGGIKG
ncbi:MAG: carbohydrate ABC transporter permease [Butyrivibrio sp.]|nr:carbohydrate ABC transporter permease [Butyrivibrio sp.]